MESIDLKGLVKNTFIDFKVKVGSASKRSSSTPASFRTMTSKCAEPVGFFPSGNTNTDTSTDASAEDASPSDSFVFGIDTDDEGSSNSGGKYECPTPPIDDAAQHQPANATRLSSKAQAFQPGRAPVFIRDPLPYEFGRQAAHVVTIAKEAVEKAGCAANVDVLNEANAWTIYIDMIDTAWSEKALTVAKEALLEGAAGSTCTYVLGYLAKPFQVRGNGFSCILCGMRDEKRACWDAYAKGFCRNPERCSLLHPCCMMRVSVVLRL